MLYLFFVLATTILQRPRRQLTMTKQKHHQHTNTQPTRHVELSMAATAAAVVARDATCLELLVIFFLITLIIFFRVSLTRQNFSKQMATAATATAPASSAPAAATPTPAAGAAGGLETQHVSSPSFFPPFSFYFLHSTAASCTHHQYQHIYFKDSKSSFSS